MSVKVIAGQRMKRSQDFCQALNRALIELDLGNDDPAAFERAANEVDSFVKQLKAAGSRVNKDFVARVEQLAESLRQPKPSLTDEQLELLRNLRRLADAEVSKWYRAAHGRRHRQ